MCHRGGISTGILRTQAKICFDAYIDAGDTVGQACDALEKLDPMAYKVYLPCIMRKIAKRIYNDSIDNGASREEALEMMKELDPKLYKLYAPCARLTEAKLIYKDSIDNGASHEEALEMLKEYDPKLYELYTPCVVLTEAKLYVEKCKAGGASHEVALEMLKVYDPKLYKRYAPCAMHTEASNFVKKYRMENNASKEEAREMLKKRDPELHKRYAPCTKTLAQGRTPMNNSSGKVSLPSPAFVDRLMSTDATVEKLLGISSADKLRAFINDYNLNLAFDDKRWPDIQSLLHSRHGVAEELEAKKKQKKKPGNSVAAKKAPPKKTAKVKTLTKKQQLAMEKARAFDCIDTTNLATDKLVGNTPMRDCICEVKLNQDKVSFCLSCIEQREVSSNTNTTCTFLSGEREQLPRVHQLQQVEREGE